MSLHDFVVVLFEAITTSNGTGTYDTVLLDEIKTSEERRQSLPALFPAIYYLFKAGSYALLDVSAVGGALTKQKAWKRGHHSQGVYFLNQAASFLTMAHPRLSPSPRHLPQPQ